MIVFQGSLLSIYLRTYCVMGTWFLKGPIDEFTLVADMSKPSN